MQATAHHPNRILQTMLCDKRVSHLASLTKYPRPLIKGWVIAIYGRLTLPLFAPLGQRHNFRRLTTSNSIVYAGLMLKDIQPLLDDMQVRGLIGRYMD